MSNYAATNPPARRGRSAADGGVAPVTGGRTGWPTGTSGTSTRASGSANFFTLFSSKAGSNVL